jgi:hypothetical protein
VTRIKPVPTYPAPDLFTEDGNVLIEFVSNLAAMKRVDFLAAVASELNVLVIERADLPEIEHGTDDDRDYLVVGASRWPLHLAAKQAEGIRRDALENLALAEYLREHPPVDEVQVSALGQFLGENFDGIKSPRTMAEALIKAGWSK